MILSNNWQQTRWLQFDMWLVKKAASTVYTLSQNAFKQQSLVQKLVNDIISNEHEVMPIRKMGELATASYEIQQFEQMVAVIEGSLREIEYEREGLKRRLNALVLVTYLIKHGAGGFIDEFRSMVADTFLRYENMINFVAEQDESVRIIMQEIRERAKYIRTLLSDTAALLREKEVGRIIKEKLFLQSGDYTSFKKESGEQQHKKTASDRIDQFLQHYVWRYTAKIDQKLDNITDILISKIDQYLEGEVPDNFEIDEETEHERMKQPSITKSEFEFGGEVVKKEEVRFIESKLAVREAEEKEEKLQVKLDLMDLQGAKPVPDLIAFNEEKPVEQKEKIMDDDQIQAFRSELIGKQG